VLSLRLALKRFVGIGYALRCGAARGMLRRFRRNMLQYVPQHAGAAYIQHSRQRKKTRGTARHRRDAPHPVSQCTLGLSLSSIKPAVALTRFHIFPNQIKNSLIRK